MNQNIFNILEIPKWQYRCNDYLVVNDQVFKYYYKSSKIHPKNLLLFKLCNIYNKKILSDLLFYFKNYNDFGDIGILTDYSIDAVKSNADFIHSNISNSKKSYQNIKSFVSSDLSSDSSFCKKNLWAYICENIN